MAVPILMPRMGYDTQEAIVVKWLKAEGDHVNLGEDIAEIETDKAIVPMPSGSTGTLLKQLRRRGGHGAGRPGARGDWAAGGGDLGPAGERGPGARQRTASTANSGATGGFRRSHASNSGG